MLSRRSQYSHIDVIGFADDTKVVAELHSGDDLWLEMHIYPNSTYNIVRASTEGESMHISSEL